MGNLVNGRKQVACLLSATIVSWAASAQCSICTKTAQQLGEGPASQLNTGIVYLMLMPFFLMGGIGVWWWRREKAVMARENNSQSLH